MSEFFRSEVVRAEMAEISELQEEVYNNVFKFPSMPKEEVKSITHYPPRICPKCGYRVPADSDLPHCNGLILCPCGKWVL